jgi:hypothetical protein
MHLFLAAVSGTWRARPVLLDAPGRGLDFLPRLRLVNRPDVSGDGRSAVSCPISIQHHGQMTVTEGARDETIGSVKFLPPNGCKARYGVGYFRTVCSQAGVGFSETSPDEDYLAVDGLVQLPTAVAAVQIKCSSQFAIGGAAASWPAKVEWRNKWRQFQLPVYFVLVVLDVVDQAAWLVHDNAGTLHRAAAFWARVDQAPDSASINIPKGQRLTAETFDGWADDVLSCFAPSDGQGR